MAVLIQHFRKIKSVADGSAARRASLLCLLLPLLPVLPAAAESPPAPDSVLNRNKNAAADLPELGGSTVLENAREKEWATKAKSFGENSNLNKVSREQLRARAENYAIGQATGLLQQQAQDLLSPLGTANVSLALTADGDFAGSKGQLFSPLYDVNGLLTYSQLGFQQRTDSSLANLGLGQRWISGDWLLGYNTVFDSDLENQRNRASVGAEAWGDYLRFSANYYQPLSAMRQQQSDGVFLSRPARGYDITTQGYLPFYRQLGATLSYEQYLGDNVDLFGSGNKQRDPRAMQLGLNYTPVPLMTLKAQHKLGDGGETQDNVELSVNYRFGVPLSKQISPEYVAQAKSLRGSRYDPIERNSVPVLEFKQRKTLQVFLATPPWNLQPGETLQLVVDIRASNKIVRVSWQGDTQTLSLTPPRNNTDPHGWSVIMPAWDDTPGAENRYRLSVTLEDEKQQRVTSNWITLQLTPPLNAGDGREEALPEPKMLQTPPVPALN
ncbi:YchO/YchP family invasin [Serratia rubidaea]|uniref:YchO/YchP family invasin n=1 Tax=Serratia rubidaea TaxID=61652 RepID=UPI00178179D3|nr:YchO/YchP family invasin [Serratia rubidaea]MBD8452639.1 YchO/YchP family invasin [Serratia rubidaea]